MNRLLLVIFALLTLGGHSQASDWSDAKYFPSTGDNSGNIHATVDPVFQEVFNQVDQKSLIKTLKQLSGSEPVMVNGATYSISERYSPEGKTKFRAFWRQYFTSLGIANQELSYNTQHSIGENQGHNLEAILPGKSHDSIVVIVHYDSTGPMGQETSNTAVDDDMTGMATMLEAAKILSKYQGHLQQTIRFVAADYEEHTGPGLEGARQYAQYLKTTSAQLGFKIIAAVDNEQSGWNCAREGVCGGARTSAGFDVFSCSGDGAGYEFSQLGDLLVETAQVYSQLPASRGCIGANSDHYALWEIGIPAVVFSEHNPFDNPHFDQNGGDTFEKIDQDYFYHIAQIGITFTARIAGLN